MNTPLYEDGTVTDTDRTDIIPGLRPSDTPRMGTPMLGRHRSRRGGHMPRWATALVFGAPVAAAGLLTGLALPGWVAGDRPAPPAGSPARTVSAAPPPNLPSPSRAWPRVDRSQPRTLAPQTSPPPTPRRSSSPTPTPRMSSPSPSPLRSSEPTPTTEPPSSPTPTDSTDSPTPKANTDDLRAETVRLRRALLKAVVHLAAGLGGPAETPRQPGAVR